jgi:hypothetical protein
MQNPGGKSRLAPKGLIEARTGEEFFFDDP